MEDYQRRKLYRVHLKNISEIRNCRTPINYTAYSSRLFNFSLKTTFRRKQLLSLQKLNSQHKMSSTKKNEQKRITNYFRERQNVRMVQRLTNCCGSIDMNRYKQQYEQHKKIMKLHRKVKQFKRVILYKIYDITFKGFSPNPKQQFTIYDETPNGNGGHQKFSEYIIKDQKSNINLMANQKYDQNFQEIIKQNKSAHENKHEEDKYKQNQEKQNYKQNDEAKQNQYMLKGNIYQLRNLVIRGFRDQKLYFKIHGSGKKQGTVTILNGENMAPIMHRNQIVGTLILQVS